MRIRYALALLSIGVLPVGLACKEDPSRSCVQKQVPLLLKQAKAVPDQQRPAFLRRQLVARCQTLPYGIQSVILHLGDRFYGRNTLTGSFRSKHIPPRKDLSAISISLTKEQHKKLIQMHRGFRLRACPDLPTKEFLYIVDRFTKKMKNAAVLNRCKAFAARFFPQEVWEESFTFDNFSAVYSAFMALQKYGVVDEQITRYIKLAALTQSHHWDIQLLPSAATQRFPYDVRMTVAIHKQKIKYQGDEGSGEVRLNKSGFRIYQIDKYYIPSMLRQISQKQRSKATYCQRNTQTRGCTAEPLSKGESIYRKARIKYLTAAQRKHFPLCHKAHWCLGPPKKWYIYVDPETPYKTLTDVLYTGKSLGWKQAYLVVGQKQVPFYGGARVVPVSFYQQGSFSFKKPKGLTREMSHWHIGVAKEYFFHRRAVKDRPQAKKRGLSGLLSKGMGMYGGGPFASKPPPGAVQLDLKGPLHELQIKDKLDENWSKMSVCRKRRAWRRKKPIRHIARLELQWQIDKRGRVQKLKVISQERMKGCIKWVKRQIQRMRFPQPGGPVSVRAALRFGLGGRFPYHWMLSDPYAPANRAKHTPKFSKKKQLFLSAHRSIPFKRIHKAIESLRNQEGKLPQIWLTRGGK